MIPFSPSYRIYKGSSLTPILLVCLMWIAGCGLVGNDDKKPNLPGTLVFSAMDDSGEYQIYSMRPDGSRLKRLTDPDFEYGPGEGYTNPFGGNSPSWSPDGTKIVFTSYYKASTIGPSLWVMNADGSNLQPLHHPEPDNIHSFPLPGNNPRFSPDGTKVVFDLCVNCQISTNNAIFVFDLETSEGMRLTNEPPGYRSMVPEWSPDGTKIAFLSNRDYIHAETERYRLDLYIMDADGSNQTRITETGFPGGYSWMDSERIIQTVVDWTTKINSVNVIHVETGITVPIMEKSAVNHQLWVFWDISKQQLLTINRTEELSVTATSYDLDGTVLVQHSLRNPLMQGAIGFDWRR
jgi:hypothetical protein